MKDKCEDWYVYWYKDFKYLIGMLMWVVRINVFVVIV